MDTFCVNKGTLLDASQFKTLDNPEEHSVHCLVDVPVCYNSGFEVLAPTDGNADTAYCRAYKLNDAGNALAMKLAKEVGSCSQGCSGTQRKGFKALFVGTFTKTDAETRVPILDVKEVLEDNGQPCPGAADGADLTRTVPPCIADLSATTTVATDPTTSTVQTTTASTVATAMNTTTTPFAPPKIDSAAEQLRLALQLGCARRQRRRRAAHVSDVCQEANAAAENEFEPDYSHLQTYVEIVSDQCEDGDRRARHPRAAHASQTGPSAGGNDAKPPKVVCPALLLVNANAISYAELDCSKYVEQRRQRSNREREQRAAHTGDLQALEDEEENEKKAFCSNVLDTFKESMKWWFSADHCTSGSETALSNQCDTSGNRIACACKDAFTFSIPDALLDSPYAAGGALMSRFLGQDIDLADLACRTVAEQEAGRVKKRFCHPGGPVIFSLVNGKEVTTTWNAQDRGKHLKDKRRHRHRSERAAHSGQLTEEWTKLTVKASVQEQLQTLNPRLTSEFIASNLAREPSAYGIVWSKDMLQTQTDLGVPDRCYYAIYAGSKCNSAGGVYRITPAWYMHPPTPC